jgi:hypothetical protein
MSRQVRYVQSRYRLRVAANKADAPRAGVEISDEGLLDVRTDRSGVMWASYRRRP